MFPVRDSNQRDLGKGLLLNDITREFELEQMKDEFIGIASHELRTPLTGVQGFAELLSETLEANTPEQEWADRINSEAKRLSYLVSDLLDASRLDSNSVVLHPERFSLNDCVNDSVQRVLAGRTPLREVMISEDAAIEIEADQGKLSQVLTNLVDNALKYSPHDLPVEVTYMAHGDRLRIEVSDHGQGIPRDQLDTIFDRFQRLDSNDPSVRGTGLGLYITRQLVELMGGSLTVTSTLGRGSTFSLDLPLHQAPANHLAA